MHHHPPSPTNIWNHRHFLFLNQSYPLNHCTQPTFHHRPQFSAFCFWFVVYWVHSSLFLWSSVLCWSYLIYLFRLALVPSLIRTHILNLHAHHLFEYLSQRTLISLCAIFYDSVKPCGSHFTTMFIYCECVWLMWECENFEYARSYMWF